MLALPHFHGIALAVAKSNLVAALPVQYAELVARDLGLAMFQPPVDVPVPEVTMYWHSRHDKDPAHKWLRGEIVAALKPLRDGETR
jgi:DNA-binding transcriptional LysR family regulator